MGKIILGDNLEVLPKLPSGFARLIYIDPPFGLGHSQKRDRIKVKESVDGSFDRIGFGGKKYVQEKIDSPSYSDAFDDFPVFLLPRIEASLHCLTDDGSLFVHLDQTWVHYIKCALDSMLGRSSFVQELIWHWDFGAKAKTRWSNKHNTILWFVRNPKQYVFNYDAIDRIPYLSQGGLVPEHKLKLGKIPTSVWWNSIVGTNSKEKTNYPSQKPLPILNRIVRVHSNPGDIVLDFFAGSGSIGESAAINDRDFILIDQNPQAIQIMTKRLAAFNPEVIGV